VSGIARAGRSGESVGSVRLEFAMFSVESLWNFLR
jgi:hypothetical protein